MIGNVDRVYAGIHINKNLASGNPLTPTELVEARTVDASRHDNRALILSPVMIALDFLIETLALQDHSQIALK